ncbi:MAG: hypothetical protein CSA76_06005 [Spirochaetales bacterium]|nr:MAG: hypothetical protein CSA76_06005 [Spirochaetales bacterium]
MNQFIKNSLRFSVPIIVVIAVLTVVLGFQALKVRTDTNINTLMPQKSRRINRIREDLGVQNEDSNYLILTIAQDEFPGMEVLQVFQQTIDRVMTIPGVESGMDPFNFIFFEHKNKRIIPGTLSPGGRVPTDAESLALFRQRVENPSLSNSFVSAENGKILTALFITSSDADFMELTRAFQEAIVPLEKITTVYYTGEHPFRERVAYLLGKDFSILLVLALVAMLIIFWLSFRSIRSVLLPIAVVAVGAIWTVGLMALMDYPITVISVIIPSLILTIGSSYTIHILNEYYRNAPKEGPDKVQWLADSVEHVFRTVVVSALTTMICFISLLATDLQPLREFGLAGSLGIFFCGLLALFFLPAMLNILPPPRKPRHEKISKGRLTRIVTWLGNGSAKNRYIVAAVFLMLIISYFLVHPAIRHQSDYYSYFPSTERLISDTRFINHYSGGSQTFNITLSAPNNEKNYFLTPEVLRKVDKLESVLNSHPAVTNNLSFLTILKAMNKTVNGTEEVPQSRGLILLLSRYFKLIPADKFSVGQESSIISEDGSRITIYLKLAEPETFTLMNEDDLRVFLKFVRNELEQTIGSEMESYLWGNTLLFMDSSRVINRNQTRSMLISLILGMIVTAVFFRSISFSIVALFPLISGICWYYLSLYLSGIPLDITTILVTNVTVGVGLDDAVHFILQYRSQRRTNPWPLALHNSLKITGRPIVLTTLALVAGLMMLFVASFKPIVYFGYLVAGTLFSTMLGTIVFIPAAIAFMETAGRRKKKDQL